jgi:hypothetical protein
MISVRHQQREEESGKGVRGERVGAGGGQREDGERAKWGRKREQRHAPNLRNPGHRGDGDSDGFRK